MKRLVIWIGVLAIIALIAAVIPHVAKAPAPSPQTSDKGWRTIAAATGQGSGATAPFVTNSRWRVVWSAGPPSGKAQDFGILVEQPGASTAYDTMANTVGSGHGTHVEEGRGTFYLDMQTSEPYRLEVQTYGTPAAQPKYTWQTAYAASGAAGRSIPLPPLKAPWRIVWSAGQGGPQGNFAISVLQPAGGLPFDYVANISGPAHGTAYEYTGGSFVLKVAATESYNITVQEGAKD